MSNDKDQKKDAGGGHIYNGFVAPPADNSFWMAVNARKTDDEPSSSAPKSETNNSGPAPTNG